MTSAGKRLLTPLYASPNHQLEFVRAGRAIFELKDLLDMVAAFGHRSESQREQEKEDTVELERLLEQLFNIVVTSTKRKRQPAKSSFQLRGFSKLTFDKRIAEGCTGHSADWAGDWCLKIDEPATRPTAAAQPAGPQCRQSLRFLL